MATNIDKTHKLNIDRLQSLYPKAYIEYYAGCSEIGYDDIPVLLADWNSIPNTVYNKLESLGFLCEWSDEFSICSECGKVVRTIADGYGWSPSYIIFNDCELICIQCLDDYIIHEYYESLENKPKNAINFSTQDKYPLEKFGYELIKDGYESGWFDGQNADPKSILKHYLNLYPDGKFLFVIDGIGQFDINFSLYRKVKDVELD